MNRFGRTVLAGVALYFLAGRVPFVGGLLGWLALAWTGAAYAGGTPRATWAGAALAGALAATLGALANVFWLVIGAGMATTLPASGVYAVWVELLHLLAAPVVGAFCGVIGAIVFGRRRWPWMRFRGWRL